MVDTPKDTSAGALHPAFSGAWLADTEAAHAAIAQAMRQVAAYEDDARTAAAAGGKARRRRAKAAQVKFETAVQALLCEASVAALRHDTNGFRCSRSKSVLEKDDRTRAPAINPLLPQALDALAALGYIAQSIGHIAKTGERRQTVVRPGDRLIELCEDFGLTVDDFRREQPGDEIILRGIKSDSDDEAPTLSYVDDGETRRLRAQMQAINAHLRQADITALPIMGEDDLVEVDASRRKLRRIFTRGSFDSGGRLYGGFWMQGLKATQRSASIRIDQQSVVELDLAQCALRILYGLVGRQPPTGDLYAIAGLEYADRDDVKAFVSGLTFVDEDRVHALAPLARKLCRHITAPIDGGLEHLADAGALRTALDCIRQQHAPIAAYHPSTIGHHVQRIESDIMVRILLMLNAKGMTGLPLHDGVLVRADQAEAAKAMMEQAFEMETGVLAVVRVKDP